MIEAHVDFGDIFARLDAYADTVKGEVIISGTAAMAKVIYDEVKLRAPVAAKAHKIKDRVVQPGALRDAVYRVYAKEISTNTRKSYEIGWNRRKAPHGHLLEFGTVKMAARPFLRPSMAMAETAIEAGKQRMLEKLKEVQL